MDPSPAQPAQHDCHVVHEAGLIWRELIAAGITVPLDPNELDLRHLVRAEIAGIDVSALLDVAEVLDQATTRSHQPAA